MDSLFAPAFFSSLGLWLGLLISLMIFSLVAGDNGVARLAQYILVGAGLGYATVLAWQSVLRPRLFVPLQSAPGDWRLWVPLILGVLLLVAGLERTLRAPSSGASGAREPDASSQNAANAGANSDAESGWIGLLHLLGALPLALMLGVAIAVGIAGAVQGTLLPQFSRAAVTGLQWGAPLDVLVTGLLGLLFTTGVLVHLRSSDALLDQQAGPLRALLRGWAWIGKRGLWLATGLIFARLLVSRLSLLIAEFEFLVARLEQTGLWRLAEQIWRQIAG